LNLGLRDKDIHFPIYVNTGSTYRINMEAVTIVGTICEEVHISTINREQYIVQVASNIPPVWHRFGVGDGDLRKLWCIIPPVHISCILYKNCDASYCQYTSPAHYTRTVMHHTASKHLLHIIQELWCTILPVNISCTLYKNCDAPYCQYISTAYYTRTVIHHTASTHLLQIIQELWYNILPVHISCILYKNCDAPYCQYISAAYYTRTMIDHTASTHLLHIIQELWCTILPVNISYTL
jgi:hypothetical protein